MKYLWTTIHVKDMEKSIAFYENILDLNVTSRFPAGPMVEIVFLGNGSKEETLVELISDKSILDISIGNHISIGFAVDSIDAIEQKLQEANIPIVSARLETPRMIYFGVKDPSGVHVQFFQQK